MTIFISLLVFYVAVVIHEFAHGWCAYKLGDPTAKYAGRLTLNPLAHIDPFGTIVLPLMLIMMRSPFIFGWAKPVPINFRNLGNRGNIALVGLAGPLANFAMAFLGSLLIKANIFNNTGLYILQLFVTLNLVLAVFNLFPLPPLDGSRILLGILPQGLIKYFVAIERYGFIILFGLIWLGLFDFIIWPIVKSLIVILGI
ncbi:MAG TPA: site-2 protease family protein [Candidatus Omnitrophica bacterium]|nr:site-2 protease family protein [Candidatus Omnitrophota bacterium]